MCGINGIFSQLAIQNITNRIIKMNSSISHRGPDSSGLHTINNKVAIGHQRLSIIDISNAGNQPMHSNSKKWSIVFNGEIYNFKEIARELNYRFISNSDTEVILAAIEQKGIEWFLNHANGMFAIGLFDSLNHKIYLMRDRLGIKPLYYYLDSNYLIFSSEIKGILNSGLIEANLNSKAIDEYLANRYIRAPFTFFKNINQVEPATYIKFDKNLKPEFKTYWDLPEDFNFDESYDENEIALEFEDELIKAIKYRLISDVPLGTYLSGGVDSSLITAITTKLKGNGINTYTIGFPEINEFNYSEIVAKQYNTSHHEILIDIKDYQKDWIKLINYKDSPLGVPNEIPLAIMSRKLKEKITVVLSGEGADELLGGYGRIFRTPFEFKYGNYNKDFYQFFLQRYDYVSREMRDYFLVDSLGYRYYFDDYFYNKLNSLNHKEILFRFFHLFHVKGLLQRVDTTTMQTAVEARVPFLDHNLIEFSYKKIPYNLKLKWNSLKLKENAKTLTSEVFSEKYDIPKYLLKKIAYKYLPKEIIERKKMGFPVPLTEWFSNLEEIAKDILPNSSWLKSNTLNELIEKSKQEQRAGQILWMFINIEYFIQSYFTKQWKW